MSIEAMKQALEALEFHVLGFDQVRKMELAIEALEKAIEQAEKQEPVAYVEKGDLYWCDDVSTYDADKLEGLTLYTAPTKREWVGLTDVEVAVYEIRLSGSGLAREIEAKLRERNT